MKEPAKGIIVYLTVILASCILSAFCALGILCAANCGCLVEGHPPAPPVGASTEMP